MTGGGLTIVGVGIQLAAHLTAEAEAYIRRAQQVCYMPGDVAVAEWIQSLNPRSEPLLPPGRVSRRQEMYRAMSRQIFKHVDAGSRVCAVFYGHPMVGVMPTALLWQEAQKRDIPCQILPGISSQDCLYSDLQLDPFQAGCQIYEATDFLIRPRRFDPSVPLILHQIGMIGDLGLYRETSRQGLRVLEKALLRDYPEDHQVTLYQANIYPVCKPCIKQTALNGLSQHPEINNLTALYLPPAASPALDPDLLDALGMRR